jgi:hypothetical protein
MPQNFRDIDQLPSLSHALDYMAKNMVHQITALERGLDAPHIFDDQVITRTIESYSQAITYCTQHREQFNHWLSKDLNQDQRTEVERLIEVNQRVCAGAERILDLCSQIKKGTIDSIMGKDDFDLGFETVTGQLKTPPSPSIDELMGGFKLSAMAAPVQRFEAALAIHQYVESILAKGGRDEEIINHPEMMNFAMQFLGIKGSGQPGEMEKLLQTFSGFHRFATVFENMMRLMKKLKGAAS